MKGDSEYNEGESKMSTDKNNSTGVHEGECVTEREPERKERAWYTSR